MNPKMINTTALAYIGDAVYEVYVRQHVLEAGEIHVDQLHHKAVGYVRADGQAKAVKYLMAENLLTEEELALVKRARNHKIASKPKNANPVTYKLATAFEALVGYLHLCGEKDRLDQIIGIALEVIKKEG